MEEEETVFLYSENSLLIPKIGVDSFLSEDQSCGFVDGLCSDTSYGRYNDITIVDSERRADVSSVDFIKMRVAGDQYDVDISPHSQTQILLAIGSMAVGQHVRFSRDNGTINFNSKVGYFPQVSIEQNNHDLDHVQDFTQPGI